MSDWPTVTPGNAWAPAQGRFLSVYRTRKADLPCTRMWLRVWPAEEPLARWWGFVPPVGRERHRGVRQWLRVAVGRRPLRSCVALFAVGSAEGSSPTLVVVTGEERRLDPDDMVAVDVYGTVAPSGHFVIDAGGWGELTPDSNPELPGQHAPGA